MRYNQVVQDLGNISAFIAYYETGMDPYSRLVDLFEGKGLLTQQGNRLKFVDSQGKEHLFYRKEWKNGKMIN